MTEEKIGKGKVMGVGERTEVVEMEVWGRIKGSEKLHCCGYLKLNLEGAEPLLSSKGAFNEKKKKKKKLPLPLEFFGKIDQKSKLNKIHKLLRNVGN